MMKLEINKVYNCDCLELMKQMKEQGIVADWLIADPPYGIGVDGIIGGEGACKNTEYTQKSWDKQRIDKEYFDKGTERLNRVKSQISFFD